MNINPDRKCFVQRDNTLSLNLAFAYVVSIFLVANFEGLKLFSIGVSSMVSALMLFYSFIKGCLTKRFVLYTHPGQKLLFMVMLWAAISLYLTKILPSKAIPDEVSSYPWTTGLNSSTLRGFSFLVRLFLSLFAIEFIIVAIDTKKKYFQVINCFLVLYSLVCCFIVAQILLYALLKVSIGYIYYDSSLFRVGGYVGEPSLMACILAGGYFLVLGVLKSKLDEIIFSHKHLKLLLAVATIDLFFTFSSAWLIGVFVVFLFVSRNYFSKKQLIVLLTIVFVALIYFLPFQEALIAKVYREATGLNPRTFSWIAGYNIFLQNIFTGVGIGQSVFFMPINMANIWDYLLDYDAYNEMIAVRFPPLNTHIQWLAETGIIGLTLIICLFHTLFTSRKRIDIEYQPLVKLGFGCGLAVYMISMNAVPDYYYVGYFNFLIAMYIAGLKIYSSPREARVLS